VCTLTKNGAQLATTLQAVAPSSPTEVVAVGRNLTLVKHFSSEPEPPEESVRRSEAPESWQRGHVEAPDAGIGAVDPIEHEFTQGRSRS
jgi:hypothetical protein